MGEAGIYEYQYTLEDTPTSPGRLVMDLEREQPADVNTQSPAPQSAWWYALPGSGLSYTQTGSQSDTTRPASSTGESCPCDDDDKRNSVERSFCVDSILDLEQQCQGPRHSTPTKDGNPTNEQVAHSPAANDVTEASDSTGAFVPVVPRVYRRNCDKPPYTYVAMVIVAITESEKKQLTLAEVREKLKTMFPFFNGDYAGWKNSIRHCLSNSKCFYRVELEDKLMTTSTYVWRVDYSHVRPSTFYRQSKGTDYKSYAMTLQEELGLPPFRFSEHLTPKDDIQLPPRPCFADKPTVSLRACAGEDFLNARNDVNPTPLSTLSDQDSVISDCVPDMKPSLKRKRSSDTPTSLPPVSSFVCSSAYPYSASSSPTPAHSSYAIPGEGHRYYPYVQNYGYPWMYQYPDWYHYGSLSMLNAAQTAAQTHTRAWNYNSEEMHVKNGYSGQLHSSTTAFQPQTWGYSGWLPYTGDSALNLTKPDETRL